MLYLVFSQQYFDDAMMDDEEDDDVDVNQVFGIISCVNVSQVIVVFMQL